MEANGLLSSAEVSQLTNQVKQHELLLFSLAERISANRLDNCQAQM